MNDLPVSRSWKLTLLRLAGLLAAALAIGWAVGYPWPALVLALAGYVGWHLVHLHRLHRALTSNRRLPRPHGWGIWSEVFMALDRRQVESRHRKRRLLSLVREIRAATEALPDGVVLLDQSMRIGWFNRGASELLGLRKGQDLGTPITNLLREPAFRLWLDSARDDPDGLIIDAPGSDRRLRLRMFAYAAGQQLLLARDITQIQRVETMRKDFVANVSHELRTPLTVISGYVETMTDDVDAQWQPVVQRLAQQSARMRAIVEDLLTLSRLDASQGLDEEVVVNVEPLLRDVAHEANLLSGGRHQIEWHCEQGLRIIGSPKDLRSVFMNLVSNAVRYTPEGGQIHFRWQSIDGAGIFCVRDNGPGIAPQHIPRLTERFYRISSDRSRSSGGTGLGLAIVKNVLALHNATLRIDSQLGKGSEFRCVFPAERVTRSLSEAS